MLVLLAGNLTDTISSPGSFPEKDNVINASFHPFVHTTEV